MNPDGIQASLRIVLAAALVFWLPGYALTAALFGRDELGAIERILLTLGSSISLTILIGFALNLVGFQLNPLTWGIGLAAVTLGAGAVAWRRPTDRPGLPRSEAWRSLRPRDWLLFGIAAVLVVGAIGLARLGAMAQPQPGFSELSWSPATGEAIVIRVRNEESTDVTYNVELRKNAAVIAAWPAVHLVSGTLWEMQIVLPPRERPGAELFLYRADAPGAIYRRVALGPVPTAGE
jgi:uncharacterized membrane protein